MWMTDGVYVAGIREENGRTRFAARSPESDCRQGMAGANAGLMQEQKARILSFFFSRYFTTQVPVKRQREGMV